MTTPDTSFLSTKLFIPSPRPDHVSRPRLVQRLEEGLRLGRKLSVLSAPAGYGKTTLLSEWIARRDSTYPPLHPVWLSLDDGDNDLARFFAYLVAAMQTIAPQPEDGPLGRLQRILASTQLPPLERLVTALINHVATAFNGPSGGTLLLVLDDYHAITELAIHEAIGFLLEHQPPHMHLAVATRHDPPLPLSRLRGRGQVTELRESDLYFTTTEAAAFLNQAMGLGLAEGQVAELEARTEGWIAGLQMAALALQGPVTQTLPARDPDSASHFIAAFSGRHQFILDYLTDEVLAGQPEPVQGFLLQTSILERITASLADALLPDLRYPISFPHSSIPNTQSLLEHLDAANLFIHPLDGERQWYRYHRLFADLLQARLQEAHPDLVPELHRCAAAWHEERGLAASAVHHALATHDHAFAIDVIGQVVGKIDTWTHVDGATYLRWLKVLPDEMVQTRPRLRLFAARALYATGQPLEAERILREVEDALRTGQADPEAESLLRRLVADRASFAVVRGDLGEGIAFAEEALANLPEDDALTRLRFTAVLALAHLRAGDVVQAGRDFSQAIATANAAGLAIAAVPLACNLAEAQMLQGQLGAALKTCQHAREMGTPGGRPTPHTGFADLVEARILYERNELQLAERQVQAGLERLSQGSLPASFGLGHALLAQIRQALDDPSGAREAMAWAVQSARDSDIPRIARTTSAHQARLWLAQGQIERAVAWASDYLQAAPAEYLREAEDLVLIRVLLAGNDAPAALSLLDRLLAPALSAGRLGTAIEIQALRALAISATMGQDQALEALEWALRAAEPEGYLRLFLDEGQPMARLLRQAATRGIAPAYTQTLLTAFGTAPGEGQAPASQYPGALQLPSPLIEPLTPREIEVLQLLSEGLTNPEIAQQLFISLPTVKSHTRNIFGKLGVHKRREAVNRARQLGIL
jgi:LuxR family maltose regulon positive regulatory protein